MLCPTCKTDLTMSERSGIEIDYCPSCRGVWLDRGELDKIIERSAVTAGPPPIGGSRPWDGAPGYAAEHRSHYPKRKKSFLHDLFD